MRQGRGAIVTLNYHPLQNRSDHQQLSAVIDQATLHGASKTCGIKLIMKIGNDGSHLRWKKKQKRIEKIKVD